MGEKKVFYLDPEDRHWNNLMKFALSNDMPSINDGDKLVFLVNNNKVVEWSEMADHCIHCMQSLVYNEEFDSVYCPSCDEWREEACDEEECDFCRARPAKPSMCSGNEDE